MKIELSQDECKNLFDVAKEEYVLNMYRPRPDISEHDRTWLRRFKNFAEVARTGEPADAIEQWTEFRVLSSESGYSLILTSSVADALDRAIRMLLEVLDETDVRSRTGFSREYYRSLVDRLFRS